jgi:putative transposase
MPEPQIDRPRASRQLSTRAIRSCPSGRGYKAPLLMLRQVRLLLEFSSHLSCTMRIFKTFKYRLRSTGKQLRLMQQTLDECCWLYNHLLEERKSAWEQRKQSLSYHAQVTSLPELKQQRPMPRLSIRRCCRTWPVRIDLAFKAFLRRLKAGEKPGYPRFRSFNRYDSFCYPQSGFKLERDRLMLSKLGAVRMVLHRPVKGTVKTCCVRRISTGKWFVALSCQTSARPRRKSKETVGIDVGLESFATFSDGTSIANPHFFHQDEQALAKAQRGLSKAVKGTPERARRRLAVAHVHERIANRRTDFAHQVSRKIVDGFGTICC